jgi:hypothetical protein
MTLPRQYIPAIGRRVTLQLFADYHQYLPTLTAWSHLTVRAVDGDIVTVEHYNAKDTGEFFTVPLAAIAPPIGWAPQYTIHVKPDQVDKVLGWFARGIVVRQSHDMSGSMPTAFQPMDNSTQPHWQFCEITDAVPAEDCRKVFRVAKIETEDIYDVYLVPQSNCKYCQGTGRRTLAELAKIRHESIAELKHKMTLPLKQYEPCEAIRLNGYDDQTETFECHCIRGNFRTLGRSKRAKLIKEWAKDGWDTHYIPYAYGTWKRTRETIVQDWE